MHTVLKDSLITAGIVTVTIFIGIWFYGMGISNSNIITIFILGVLFIAAFTNGRIYGLSASVINVLALNFFFTEPRYSLQLSDAGYIITFFVMFIASFITSTLALQMKKQSKRSTLLEVQAQREKLRANLLRTISHDLRTPLTAISGNARVLMDSSAELDEAKKQQIYGDIYNESKWLYNVIENLLHITRMDNGKMVINAHPELVSDVINNALQHIDDRKAEYKISVVQSDNWIMAKMDPRLIIHVIINLVNNAIAYTPAGSEITVGAHEENNGMVVISVADNGEGISDAEKEKLFDLYHDNPHKRPDDRRGLGLGLPLCKAIITAHGGTISVKNNSGRGTVVSFTLASQAVSENE